MSEWGSDETTLAASNREIPLQFKALFAEMSPSNGEVSTSKLGSLLTRAGIRSSEAASILQESAGRCASVQEPDVYRALAMARGFQVGEAANKEVWSDLDLSNSPGDIDESVDQPIPAYNPFEGQKLIRVSRFKNASGAFVFKHVVFSVSGLFNDEPFNVVRRYSDFCRLLEQLVHIYPFRILPVLPPKRLGISGRFLTGDTVDFLERRRFGLEKFINLVAQHPVVSQHPLVRTFLFVESQFEVAQRQVSLKPELENHEASPVFISRWDEESEKLRWEGIRLATDEFIAQIAQLSHLLERAALRRDAAAADWRHAGRSLLALSRSLHDAYPDDQSRLSAIQSGLEEAASATQEVPAVLSEAHALSDLRFYRLILLSIRELFSRHAKLSKTTIPVLEKRIHVNQQKLAERATQSDVSDEELLKVRIVIQESQEEIQRQRNRSWSIREIMGRELRMVQSSQLAIPLFISSLADEVTSDAENASLFAHKLSEGCNAMKMSLNV